MLFIFQVGQHNDFVIKDLSNSGATAPPSGDNMMKSSSKNSGNSNMAPPETETTVVMRRSKSGGKISFDFFPEKQIQKVETCL